MTNPRQIIAQLAREAGPFYATDDARDVLWDLRSVCGDPDEEAAFGIADVRAYLASLAGPEGGRAPWLPQRGAPKARVTPAEQAEMVAAARALRDAMEAGQ